MSPVAPPPLCDYISMSQQKAEEGGREQETCVMCSISSLSLSLSLYIYIYIYKQLYIYIYIYTHTHTC